MGLAKDDCGELMDRTVASSVIVPRPGLEVKGAAETFQQSNDWFPAFEETYGDRFG